MPLFQLDPASIAARARAAAAPVRPLTLAESVGWGVAGFIVVSLAGFAPWPILDRWFPYLGEGGLYVACTAMFIGFSGLCLHRLIIGPGSRGRFYKVFALAFLGYAGTWVGCWMWLRGGAGELAGLAAGSAVLGAILAGTFGDWRAGPLVGAAFFALHGLGYYAGGWIEGRLAFAHRLLAMTLWGVCYGIGFGAGLGVAFYVCQRKARQELAPGR